MIKFTDTGCHGETFFLNGAGIFVMFSTKEVVKVKKMAFEGSKIFIRTDTIV